MNSIIRADILAILAEIENAIDNHDIARLKPISNHTIHNASIFQDHDSVMMAIVTYSLYKVITLEALSTAVVRKHLKAMQDHLADNNIKKYNEESKKLLRSVSRADDKLKLYIDHVIEQAEIKKGSKLYDHGISASTAANIMGISVWDLMNYIGKTEINERFPSSVNMKQRIITARNLFDRR
ncbi:MAG: hypothetical protein ACMXYL_02680 [Candidatus Woesearchaeota archaeon]